MNNILTEFNSISTKVELLLKNYKSLRNDDTKLWISYLVMYHDLQRCITKAKDPCQVFCNLILDPKVPNISSILRIRQKLQASNTALRSKLKVKSYKRRDVTGNVLNLLKHHKSLRNDDKQLWVAYLIAYHNLKHELNTSNDPYETLCDILIEKIPAMDTIRRCRQSIQESGIYLSDRRRKQVARKKGTKYG